MLSVNYGTYTPSVKLSLSSLVDALSQAARSEVFVFVKLVVFVSSFTNVSSTQ